ncbi:hypothetical protein, partial [Streptomyces sp. SID3343]|uniref:hypothetical protein n=1 Tax=Streptomyces sp. SID3343 TaxID=2690260 RepID=UPI00136E4D85
LGHRLDGADAIASAYTGIVTLAEDFEADFDPADYVDDFRENHVGGHILRRVPFAHPTTAASRSSTTNPARCTATCTRSASDPGVGHPWSGPRA